VKIDMTFDAVSHGQLYTAKPIVFGGHQAYQEAEIGSSAGCTFTAPVSFDLALPCSRSVINASKSGR